MPLFSLGVVDLTSFFKSMVLALRHKLTLNQWNNKLKSLLIVENLYFLFNDQEYDQELFLRVVLDYVGLLFFSS